MCLFGKKARQDQINKTITNIDNYNFLLNLFFSLLQKILQKDNLSIEYKDRVGENMLQTLEAFIKIFLLRYFGTEPRIA